MPVLEKYPTGNMFDDGRDSREQEGWDGGR